MSWSVALIGSPERIAEDLQKESARLTGQTKIEFDAALPHMIGLLVNNFSRIPGTTVAVSFYANGHGSERDGEQMQRTCSVKIEPMYIKIV